MKTECPHCRRFRELPDAYAGRAVKCPDCGQEHTLTAYVPPEPEVVTPSPKKVAALPPLIVERPPSDGGGFGVLGWVIVVGSVILAVPTQGVSLAGLAMGVLLIGIGAVIDYLCKIAWYARRLYEREKR